MSSSFIDANSTKELATEVADFFISIIAPTIGPSGSPIIIPGKFDGDPRITKDGVSVAKEIEMDDSRKSLLLKLLCQSADKTNQEAGDGTTTVSLLTAGILREFSKVNMNRRVATKVQEGIERSATKVTEYLIANTRAIKDNEQIEQIAVISSNGDKNIGSKIANAFALVGNDGNITVEEGKSLDPFIVEKSSGTVLQRGYTSPYFVTNTKKELVEFDNPYILLVNEKISAISSLVNILEKANKTPRPLLIIAEDYESEVTSLLALNKMRGLLKVAAIKAPGFGDRRAEMLEDYRILLGSSCVVSKDVTLKTLEEIELEDLGSAKKVIISKDKTIILNDEEGATPNISSNQELADRVNFLKEKIKEVESDYDREKLEERLGQLCGGVAVLKVGGATDVEVKERRDRVDDALNATKAAVAEGVIPGGGATLLYATKVLDDLIANEKDDDIKAGMIVFKNALKLPIHYIVSNSGEDSSVVMYKMLQQDSNVYIYDAYKKEFVKDAFEAGIIDPVKVTRIAIKNAASIAGLIVSSGGCVVKLPKKNDD
ncbi:MAG: molecular chaperone GroEL, partial [Anaplasmataceae bacterium]|nr:molecular chaperone GroEL [Anaplasmataceae bacterium]